MVWGKRTREGKDTVKVGEGEMCVCVRVEEEDGGGLGKEGSHVYEWEGTKHGLSNFIVSRATNRITVTLLLFPSHLRAWRKRAVRWCEGNPALLQA